MYQAELNRAWSQVLSLVNQTDVETRLFKNICLHTFFVAGKMAYKIIGIASVNQNRIRLPQKVVDKLKLKNGDTLVLRFDDDYRIILEKEFDMDTIKTRRCGE